MAKPLALLIDASGGTTTYYSGQFFTTAGIIVKVRYTGNVITQVYNYTYLAASPLDINTTSVIFSYKESGITLTATLAITVLPAQATSISISASSLIRTTQYFYKEKLLSNINDVAITFSNGTTSYISLASCTVTYPNNLPYLSSGSNVVNISYNYYGSIISVSYTFNVATYKDNYYYGSKYDYGNNTIFLANLDNITSLPLETFFKSKIPLELSLIYSINLHDSLKSEYSYLPNGYKINIIQRIVNDVDGYKLIDSNGIIHRFKRFTSSSSYYYDEQEPTTILIKYTSYYVVFHNHVNSLKFNSDGYLYNVVVGGPGSGTALTLNITYNSDYSIDTIYYSHDQNTKIYFEYSNGKLTNIREKKGDTLLSRITFVYSSNKLTYVRKISNDTLETTLPLYSFSYNSSNSSLEKINLNTEDKAYKFTYIYLSNIYKYQISKIESGYFSSNNFVKKESVEFTYNGQYLYTIRNVKNEKNVVLSNFLDDGYRLASTFEYKNNNYYSLESNDGVTPSLSSPSSTSTLKINNDNVKTYNGSFSISSLSSTLNNLISNETLFTNYTYFAVNFYLRLNSSHKRVRANIYYSSSNHYYEVDAHVKDGFQKVSLPFYGNISSLTIYFVDENGSSVSFDIADVVVNISKDYGSYIELSSNTNPYSLNDLSSFSYNNTTYKYPITPLDISLSIQDRYYISRTAKLFYYDNGRKVIVYSSSNSIQLAISNETINFPSSNVSSISTYNRTISLYKAEYISGVLSYIEIETKQKYSFTSSNKEIANITTYINHYTSTNIVYESIKKYDLYSNLVLSKITHPNVDGVSYISTSYSYNKYNQLLLEKQIPYEGASEYILIKQITYNVDGSINSVFDGFNTENYTYDGKDQLSSTTLNSSTTYKEISHDAYQRSNSIKYFIAGQSSNINDIGLGYNSNSFLTIINPNSNTLRFSNTTTHHYDSSYNHTYNEEKVTVNNVDISTKKYYPNSFSQSFSNNQNDTIEYEKDNYDREYSINGLLFNYSSNKESENCKKISNIEQNYYLYSYHSYNKRQKSYSNSLLTKKISTTGSIKYTLFNDEDDMSFYIPPEQGAYLSFNEYGSTGLSCFSFQYDYDSYSRLQTKEVLLSTSSQFVNPKYEYEYYSISSTSKTIFPSKVKFTFKNYTSNINYKMEENISYSNGKISSRTTELTNLSSSTILSSNSFSYTYDGYDRLKTVGYSSGHREYNYSGSLLQNVCSYNSNNVLLTTKYFTHGSSSGVFGNIVTISEYNNATSSFIKSTSYTYDNFGRRITSSDSSETISYEYLRNQLSKIEINNPSSYYTKIKVEYEYDLISGMRTSKKHSYYYNGSYHQDYQIVYAYDGKSLLGLRKIEGTRTIDLRFFYDSNGVCGFIYKDSLHPTVDLETYFLVRNSLGDVTHILNSSWTPIIEYEYDEYGNTDFNLLVTPADQDEQLKLERIATLNPFRYRGYVYDDEVGLYYLITRYYDPYTYSFLNPDDYSYISMHKLGGCNLYCYCLYNPIMCVDQDGHDVVLSLLLTGIGIGALIGASTNIISQYVANKSLDNFNWGLFAWNTFIGAVGGALSTSSFGTLTLAFLNAGLSAIGTIGSHAILGNNFNSKQVWIDVGVSGAIGFFSSFFGKKFEFKDVRESPEVAKKMLSYGNVLSKVTSGQYSSVRNANIALGIVRNNLVKTWNNTFSLLMKDVMYDSLLKNAFLGIGYSMFSSMLEFD